jgi:hypothetical protein
MPLSGKEFRRISAQARALTPGESRRLIDRILPRGAEGAARDLRLATGADRAAAPVAIFAAVNADEITWDDVEKLLSEVERAPVPEPAEQGHSTVDWTEWDANFLRGMVEGPRKYWGIEPDEDFVRAINADLIKMGKEPVPLAPRSATKESGSLVNINENTNAKPQCDAGAARIGSD